MLLYTFSGTAVLLGLAVVCGAITLGILLLRRRRPMEGPGYWLRHTGPAHRLSLCAALLASFLAMNWTRFEAAATPDFNLTIEDEDFLKVTPRTATPPPPVVIEPVVEPTEEPVAFIDQTLNPEDAVTVETPPVISTAPAPPPPPPPPPPAPVVEEGPVIFAERMPVFGEECFDLGSAERKQCSDRALLAFLNKHLDYPSLARQNGIEGTVVVRFVVERDGTVSNLETVRGQPGGLSEAALKAVREINSRGIKFQPGMQQGRKVRVSFNLPIRFTLS